MSEHIPPEHLPFSEKVDEVLLRMARDRRLKRTKAKLAELCGCARGTLYNYGWPITRLENFRLAEKQQVKSARPSDTTHKFDATKSDKELLSWKRRCDALNSENEGLKKRLEELREQLRNRREPPTRDNVVPLSPRCD